MIEDNSSSSKFKNEQYHLVRYLHTKFVNLRQATRGETYHHNYDSLSTFKYTRRQTQTQERQEHNESICQVTRLNLLHVYTSMMDLE